MEVNRLNFESDLNGLKGRNMNVGQYAGTGAQERDPFLSLKDGEKVSGKILGVREVNSPPTKKEDGTMSKGFAGLFLTVKIGSNKYAHPLRFGGFDLPAVIAQLESTETDDWIGCNIQFIGKKGEQKDAKGKTVVFTNVVMPKSKKKK
jgi:hypothetical protein